MKKMRRIIVLAIIMSLIISIFLSLSSYAITAGDMVSKAHGFIDKGSDKADGVNIGSAVEPLSGFGSILTTIGVGVLVIVTIVMGIRYITATPETQGKLKQQLIGLVVAAFVIFGSYAIWKIVVDVVRNL